MQPSQSEPRNALAAPQRVRVQAAPPPDEGASLSLDDIYYTLFRHKAKIVLCTLLGLLGAAGWMLSVDKSYVSTAKLFVRYVEVEGLSSRPSLDDTVKKSPDRMGETIMSSEQEIISSLDLLRQVAQVVGPEKILALYGGGNDINAAAIVVRKGFLADAQRFSSIIAIRFEHKDPTLVQPVLREVINQYFKKHIEIHRSSGMVGDFLSQETDQLRAGLAQTEDELRKAKTKAGVVSLDEAKASFSAQLNLMRQQIFSAQAELVERTSVLQEYLKANPKEAPTAVIPPNVGPTANQSSPGSQSGLGNPAPPATLPTNSATNTPPDAAKESPVPTSDPLPAPALIEEYRAVLARVEFLRRRELELLVQFTAETPRVKEVRAQLAEAQEARQKIETDNPILLRQPVVAPTSSPQTSRPPAIDVAVETIRINGLQAKIKALNNQMESVRAEVASLEQAEGNIRELMRKKELQEANYRHYSASLEQSRINEALGSGRVSNISQIQTPTPPFVENTKAFKIPGGIAGGGLGLGLALAFGIEMFLDRSIRRPVHVEKKLRLPLFMTFPYFGTRRRDRLFRWWRRRGKKKPEVVKDAGAPAVSLEVAAKPNDAALAVPPHLEELLPFHDTLRDRLIGYFESRGLTHKPKLVAVTGISHGAGVTTTAAGLAKSLSETGDGNVLLVDLAPGNVAARQFFHGKAVCGLEEMLEIRESAQVQDRLFVVANGSGADGLAQVMPQRFRHLVPKLKASNFDYIIFDMPPVSQISITPRVAGLMDIVLLVTESEKDTVELMQRANSLLVEAKADVGVVLNKTRNYVPTAIHREELGH